MGDFFTDPFGGSLPGRVWTKVAKTAGGDTSYKVFNSEKNNTTSHSTSVNDKFTDTDSKPYVATAQKFKKNEYGKSEPINRNQSTKEPSTWQKIKTKVSNWWNNKTSSGNEKEVIEVKKNFSEDI